MDLSAHVADFFRRHGLEQTAGIIAISGGPDSVALAHLLLGAQRAGKIGRLILAHVNHQLRDGESDADEEFVRRLPALWQADLPCFTQRIDTAALAAGAKDNLENTARRERYRWLTQLAQTERAAWVATGHTADDQAETVLFRLLRGSGILGLGGMHERRPLSETVALLRPLLALRRQQLLDHLHAGAIPYRVDSSNLDERFTRNRLRLHLLPQLEQHYNPGIIEVLCRLAEQAREWHGEISRQAAQLLAGAELPRAGDIFVFSVPALVSASANLVREMFRLVWQRENWPMGEMDFPRWHRVVEIVQGTRSACDFPGNIHVRRVGNVLQIQRTPLAA